MLPEAEQFEDHLKPPDPVPPEDEFVNDGHHTDVQVLVSAQYSTVSLSEQIRYVY